MNETVTAYTIIQSTSLDALISACRELEQEGWVRSGPAYQNQLGNAFVQRLARSAKQVDPPTFPEQLTINNGSVVADLKK